MTDRKDHRKNLFYLHELSDYKVDSHDPDVRGWSVKDVDNRIVGKVDNLLVNKDKKRVVYLDIEVDKSIIDANHDPYGSPASADVHEFMNKDGENHLILPIGMARLNEDDKFIYTDRINHQTFAETKRMEKGYDIDREYEVVVLESYNRDYDRETGRDSRVGTGSTAYNITGTSSGVGREDTLDDERRRMQEADRERSREERDSGHIAGRTSATDRRATDRERDSLTGGERGTRSGRDTGNFRDDDSFYDRGEFDYDKYRNRKDRS